MISGDSEVTQPTESENENETQVAKVEESKEAQVAMVPEMGNAETHQEQEAKEENSEINGRSDLQRESISLIDLERH